ncbi:MAG: DUF2490 domain-containing protein [Pontixanthobacter sp.]
MPDLRPIISLMIALAAAALVPVQACAADQDTQIWLLPTAKVDLSDSTSLTVGEGTRFGDDAGGLSQLFLRAYVDVDAGDNLTLGGGYGHFQNFDHGVRTGTEERFFQQANWSMGHALGGDWTSRSQVEERLYDHQSAMRVRERIQWRGDALGGAVLGDRGSKVRPVLSVELLAEIYDGAKHTGTRFSSTRESAGISIAVSKPLTLDLAYQNIWAPRSGQDKMIHVDSAVVSYHF